MAPQVIAGRYHVERAVGQGGMGTVWLCRDELLGRQVAVKQVGTVPGETTPAVARALREARSSAALNHRNVVAIFDAVADEDQIWLVMEYVPSRTLSQILAEDGPLPPERAVWIGAQVADGLAAAHARGTIHRDVKPGNILVTEDDFAKVGDFGISRTYGDAQLTESGMVIGTPAYFSPELARGLEPTQAADVWALGATLYAAVEGRPPYPEHRNPLAVLAAIAAGQPPPPEHAGFLAAPIRRMLDPDFRSRWSMGDAAHALHRLAAQHAPSHGRIVTRAFATPPVARPASWFADGDDTHDIHREHDQADDPAPHPSAYDDEGSGLDEPEEEVDDRRHGGLGLVVAAGLVLALVAVAGYLLLDQPWRSTPSAPAAASLAGDSPSPVVRTRAPRSASPQPSATPSQTPSRTPQTPDAASASPSSALLSGTPPAAAKQSAQQMVRGYYAALPGDTATGWSLLSPGFQAQVGGYAAYRGFWSTIASVTVTDTARAGNDVVDVSLTYTGKDGDVDREVRRIYLARSGDGFLITDDAVVG